MWQEFSSGKRATEISNVRLLHFCPFYLLIKGLLSFLFKAVLKQNGAQDLEKNGAEEDQDEIAKADPEMTPFEIFLKNKRYVSV